MMRGLVPLLVGLFMDEGDRIGVFIRIFYWAMTAEGFEERNYWIC